MRGLKYQNNVFMFGSVSSEPGCSVEPVQVVKVTIIQPLFYITELRKAYLDTDLVVVFFVLPHL